ncbi:MAG: cell division protein FtsQ [Gaiellaceae bacterium]|nr:cell division protein FtsQ [Gaiellaceae bacterium]
MSRIARFLPSRRSLAIGVGIVALAGGAYAIARETSLFAIHEVRVTGGGKAVDAQVVEALGPLLGSSLVGLDGAQVLQRVEELPTVVSATYDRAFPNTLRLNVVPERAVAVLRDGAAAWVVSERGRVMKPIAAQGAPTLPRIWVAAKTVNVGEVLPLNLGGTLTRVLTASDSFRARVGTASLADGRLVFHLRSGLELVLGTPSDIALKLAVAARVLQEIPYGTRTVDVSVPSRPVTSVYSSST